MILTVLVMGGCGDLGSKIVNCLAVENRVIVADWLPNAEFEGNGNIRFVPYELLLGGALAPLLDEVDVVIHLISTLFPVDGMKDLTEAVVENIFSSIRLLVEISVYGKMKILFVSSGGDAYGDGRFIPTVKGERRDAQRAYALVKAFVEKAIGTQPHRLEVREMIHT